MAKKRRTISDTTIVQVAEAAGVSVKTVSRVLGGFEGVRAETRQHVERVMMELEYFPSAAARQLRGHGTRVLALIGDHLTTTPESFELVQGVQSVCDATQTLLMIGETGGEPDAFERLVAEFRRQRVLAIIRATNTHRQVQVEHPFTQLPFVLLNCFEQPTRYPTVVPDDRGGAHTVVSELIARGHDRIAYLGLSPVLVSTRLRRLGYEEALEASDRVVDGRLIRFVGTERADHDGLAELPAILDQLFALEAPPTAIICGSDRLALRVVMLLGQRDVRVPADVSVVGYGDYPPIANSMWPRLTTVDQPYFDMGVRAAHIALEDEDVGEVVVSSRVIHRDSIQ